MTDSQYLSIWSGTSFHPGQSSSTEKTTLQVFRNTIVDQDDEGTTDECENSLHQGSGHLRSGQWQIVPTETDLCQVIAENVADNSHRMRDG